MARSIYIASPAAGTGKSTVALGLVSTLTKVVAKVGVFRPFVTSRQADPFLDLLLARSGSATPTSAALSWLPSDTKITLLGTLAASSSRSHSGRWIAFAPSRKS